MVLMSPAWQYLALTGLSRTSLLLGSGRSCDSAGSALLRCWRGYQPKISLIGKLATGMFQDLVLPEKRVATNESTQPLQHGRSAQRLFGSFALRFVQCCCGCTMRAFFGGGRSAASPSEAKRGLSLVMLW